MTSKKPSKTGAKAAAAKTAPKTAAPKKNKTDPRENIDIHAIIAALETFILKADPEKLTPVQVTAALALLKKIVPDASDNSKKNAGDDNKSLHEKALGELE